MLTRRQVEGLQTLLRLFGDSPAGVHYRTLARRMGVSKWTAYDMLRTLEERGLVERHYDTAKKGRHGGRPRVMFAPTRQGIAALADALGDEGGEPEWTSVSEALLESIDTLTAKEAQERLDALGDEPSTLSRCAHLLTSLTVVTRDAVQDSATWELLDRILQGPLPFATKVAAFSGAVTSAHLRGRRRAKRESQMIQKLLSALEAHVPRLRLPERAALIEFVQTVLRRLREAHT